jgi:hypothetical protein
MLRVLRGEVRATKLDHLAGPDEKHVLARDRRVDALRKLHRGRRHRNGARPDLGLCAHRLRDRERPLKKLVQDEAERAGGFRAFHRLLELAEDLRLAEHHRIETARHSKRVLHRLVLREMIEIRLELLGFHAVVVGEPAHRGVRLDAAAVNLGPIAGRNDRGFFHPLAFGEIAKRDDELFSMKHHALAHVERRGVVVQSESEKLHVHGRCRNWMREALGCGPFEARLSQTGALYAAAAEFGQNARDLKDLAVPGSTFAPLAWSSPPHAVLL